MGFPHTGENKRLDPPGHAERLAATAARVQAELLRMGIAADEEPEAALPPAPAQRRVPTCRNGHARTPAAAHWSAGQWRCRLCDRERKRQARAAKKGRRNGG